MRRLRDAGQQTRRLIALASALDNAELVDLLGYVNNTFTYPAKANLLVLSSTILKGCLLCLSKPGPVEPWSQFHRTEKRTYEAEKLFPSLSLPPLYKFSFAILLVGLALR